MSQRKPGVETSVPSSSSCRRSCVDRALRCSKDTATHLYIALLQEIHNQLGVTMRIMVSLLVADLALSFACMPHNSRTGIATRTLHTRRTVNSYLSDASAVPTYQRRGKS